MIPPLTIPLSSVDLSGRGRTEYHRIEELAQSIKDNGLIQPLVLVPLPLNTFGLDAGGRRFKALQLLNTEVLYHAATSDPERPGYILKGEQFTSPFQRAMTELAENLDREDPDWRDQVKMISCAWKLALSERHANGEDILMRDFGSMCGVQYSKVQAAISIHDDLIVNPERYKDVTGIRAAYTKLLKTNLSHATIILASKSIQPVPGAASVSAQDEPEPTEAATEKPIVIPLTSAFVNCDSLEYMKSLPGPTFDHIVTDPDYGVSVERLESNMSNANVGIEQESVEDSVQTFKTFITQAFRVIKDQGFLVFFYDLDHHEKLQRHATEVGFSVQRWPLIWVKSDYRSNAASAYNFCKNIEYVMVCRKPNAVLARAQMSSVFTTSSGAVTRDLGHPFAKPYDLSKWIYSAITIKGQTVYDPFMGSAAMSIAAAEFGLKPVGSEISLEHYSNALVNLQNHYRKVLNGKVTFT